MNLFATDLSVSFIKKGCSIGRKWIPTVVYLFIGLFLFHVLAYSQSNIGKPDLDFQRIHEGLISNRISAIYQDNLGFMWIGTYSGLHRYNGLEFQIYISSPDSNSISDNYIGAIYEDRYDDLWIGTSRGIDRYNRETDDFTRFELPSNNQNTTGISTLVNTIVEDSSGTLWVSGNEKSLYYLDRKEKQFIPYGNLGEVSVNSIAIDDHNNIWLGTNGNGLGKLNIETGELHFFQHNPSNSESLSSMFIDCLIIDKENNLWIGTANSGLDRLDLNENEFIFHHYRHERQNPYSLGNNNVFELYIDNDEKLWVGNENGGLHLYNKETDSFFRYLSDPSDPTSLTHNSIWSIFEDNHGRIWIGTAQSGINVADKFYSKFTHYYNNSSTQNSLNNDIIRDFWAEENGDIWIATDGGGLNHLDRSRNTFKAFEHNPDDPQSLGANAVIALNEDEKGNLWVGTWGGGLNIMLDKEEGTFTGFKDFINNDDYAVLSVFDVLFDDPYIWVSSFEEGLIRYNKNSGEIDLFSSSSDSSSLSSNFILRIYEDSNENIWVGTLEGLNFLSKENKDAEEITFQRFLHSHLDSTTVAGNTIHQILEDQNNNIWIATANGLSKYSGTGNTFHNYYHSDGLPISEIRSIIEDDNGYLWIGTISGLSRMEPETETFLNFDKSDGLQSNEFSRYSVHETPAGELLFGGLAGFNIFDPDEIQNNPYAPPVYLTDLKIFNESVDVRNPDSPLQKHIAVTDTLVLSYKDDVITFDFIALNYTRPEYNQYAYMVEGFEEDWNYVGSQRNATYTNLDPSEYTLRVKASNNDGVWNEEGTSLTLFITPPFWQTTWFYLLSALFIAGIIFSVYRLRVRSIREHNRQLEQQVAERTEELKEKNKDLERTLAELEATKDELVEKAHKAGMADIATGVLHNVGNVLTSVNTSASLIEDMVTQSKLEGLFQANLLLRENIDHIEEFISNNPKGKNLLKYYLKLESPLKNERQKLRHQSQRLIEKIELINEIIAAQQSYAGTGINAENVSLNDVIENALALQAGSIERHNLLVEKDLQHSEQVMAQRSKLIHVLVNIIKNAKEAMDGIPPEEKKIFIKTWQDSENVYLSIQDTGHGIKSEHMGKIFTQGFTTKKKGHGFGLHSSANYMAEMDGNIKVSRNGEGDGASFTLSLPLQNSKLEPVEEEH